jgi:predicted ATP-grasp superfamily ATP-dependent carboligase
MVFARLALGYGEAVTDGARRRRPALVLDADLRQSLVTVRSLGRAGVTVHAAEMRTGSPAFVSRWCASASLLPDVAADPAAFAAGVIELCESIGRPVLITSHDGSIEALRAHREEIEAVATLALAAEPSLGLAVDKRQTLLAAERLGLNIPRGMIVDDRHGADEALERLGLPIVVKSVTSWIGSGATAWRSAPALARTRGEALALVAPLLECGASAVLQQWLPGDREAISLLFAQGAVQARFAQRADRVYPLLGGADVLRESIAMPDDTGSGAEALIREISLEGFSQVEWRRDADGRPFLMEINSRLSASIETAVRAGVDFPLLLYRWAAGEPLHAASGYRRGYRMRHLRGDVGWLKEALRDPEHPDAPDRAAALASFLTSFMRPSGYDYWDRRDPAPAALVASRTARSLPGRLLRAIRRARPRRRDALAVTREPG